VEPLQTVTVGPTQTVTATRRYERGSMIITSNKSFTEWGGVLGDDVLATAILDRLLHHRDVLPSLGTLGLRRPTAHGNAIRRAAETCAIVRGLKDPAGCVRSSSNS
jgi:IstB-like ATP binding protein